MRLDCAHTTVSGDGDTLSINWHVRPEQRFDGGCGWNRAYELVSDSAGLRDIAMVGAVAAGRDKQLTQGSRRVCRLAGRALAGGRKVSLMHIRCVGLRQERSGVLQENQQ
jgi:hypothetical protein